MSNRMNRRGMPNPTAAFIEYIRYKKGNVTLEQIRPDLRPLVEERIAKETEVTNDGDNS